MELTYELMCTLIQSVLVARESSALEEPLCALLANSYNRDLLLETLRVTVCLHPLLTMDQAERLLRSSETHRQYLANNASIQLEALKMAPESMDESNLVVRLLLGQLPVQRNSVLHVPDVHSFYMGRMTYVDLANMCLDLALGGEHVRVNALYYYQQIQELMRGAGLPSTKLWEPNAQKLHHLVCIAAAQGHDKALEILGDAAWGDSVFLEELARELHKDVGAPPMNHEVDLNSSHGMDVLRACLLHILRNPGKAVLMSVQGAEEYRPILLNQAIQELKAGDIVRLFFVDAAPTASALEAMQRLLTCAKPELQDLRAPRHKSTGRAVRPRR